MRPEIDLLRGLLDYVDTCLDRDDVHGARAALDDAQRLDSLLAEDEEEFGW